LFGGIQDGGDQIHGQDLKRDFGGRWGPVYHSNALKEWQHVHLVQRWPSKKTCHISNPSKNGKFGHVVSHCLCSRICPNLPKFAKIYPKMKL
jgi:hypothetical protein